MPWSDDFYRCAVLMHDIVNGAKYACVFGVEAPGSDPVTVATDFANGWGNNSSSLQQLMSNSISFDEVICSQMSESQPSGTVDFSTADWDSGQTAQEPVSPQVCLVLTWRTDLGGRANRGRTYLPGMPKTSVIDNQARWSTAGPPTLQDRANTTFANLTNGAITNLEVLHRKTQDATHITSVTAQTGYLGTQRRRAEQFE
jgi:hypothetical protein